jgi:hypothetical protein
MQLRRKEVMRELHELTDTEVEMVCGGVSDLGNVITKAVDEAVSAIIGGTNTGIVPGPKPPCPPTKIVPL